ncbi:hypothetical protein WR25_14271 [Diploscapter pachys]|uniref:Fatty acid hydroxylase domain-containing protein n=1 Tax=Diploscapter pachys TaxID=2018661 RepID=A0A2A2LWA7_9BILA|nr:hypothetical protein WR25_14271 [Diploscapter pachys]
MIEYLYSKLYDYFEGDGYKIHVIGGILYSAAVFWTVNIPFAILDFTRPQWAERYRMQEGKKERAWTLSDYLYTVLIGLRNQFIVGFIVLSICYFVGQYTGVSYAKDTIPSGWIIFLQVLSACIFQEIGIYYTHRSLHHPRLYKHFHKQHHEWNMPVSIASIYCTAFEHAYSNLGSILIGPTLFGYHIAVVLLHSTIAMMTTTVIHSSYHFPYTYSGERHDWHHHEFNENYGANGMMDWFHGTSKRFLASPQYQRHKMYFTLTPIREIFPDESKKLTTKLNAKRDKVDEQEKIVNSFYKNGKFGKPKPNQRVLSWYDDKDYSKKKLISLVEQRVCVKKFWSKWMPVLKNRYGEANAQKHKDLFSFLDIQFLNSIERSLGMYWNAAYYKDYMKNGEDKAYQFYEQFAATLNQQFYETPQLAWVLYDTNWEKNYNQTYPTGKW